MDNTWEAAIRQIVNHEIVYHHFGHWPTFHAAEVTKVIFETHTTGRYSVTAVLEPDRNIHYVGGTPPDHPKPCRIELQFTGVQEWSFANFGVQNALEELWFEERGGALAAFFVSSSGMKATIVADEVLVLSLVVL
ncbi:Imm50 family immunity protein [Hymenobacter jeollabukensis]|uniref:Uncharacterized protein n=1 Tax=Hymenobacter jeollabukensis TaxID=2025313 RepID=A0A5R8WLF6_9BACT|nr:Imm50 family immunity protein [Hymenobacter jeollabukensis]TLM89995.1 hypothetical protein FDY95_18400 [Hymenobacter jeollabukensis]